MAIGLGEGARDIFGGAGLCALDLMRSTALGGGEGILKVCSSLSGDEAAVFLTEPPGGCAVFMLEYGAHLDFGFVFSGVVSVEPTDPL